MRKLAITVAALGGLAVIPAPASAVPLHLHCLTTPGGTHAIAGGVTANAPHNTAFHNFHNNVHTGAFAGQNPNTVTATAPTGSCE
jgi:hypothetical protein